MHLDLDAGLPFFLSAALTLIIAPTAERIVSRTVNRYYREHKPADCQSPDHHANTLTQGVIWAVDQSTMLTQIILTPALGVIIDTARGIKVIVGWAFIIYLVGSVTSLVTYARIHEQSPPQYLFRRSLKDFFDVQRRQQVHDQPQSATAAPNAQPKQIKQRRIQKYLRRSFIGNLPWPVVLVTTVLIICGITASLTTTAQTQTPSRPNPRQHPSPTTISMTVSDVRRISEPIPAISPPRPCPSPKVARRPR